MKALLALGLILALTNESYAYKEFDESILNECQNSKKILKVDADCNDMFHHYKSSRTQPASAEDSGKVKIAGYNIYKLGVGETRYKDLDLTAKMMNQWDVIGAVEPQPALAEDKVDNENIIELLNEGKVTLDFAKEHYKTPTYLELLFRLRKLDRSWSMIVSPYGQSKNIELVAFYYRRSKVKPAHNAYCKKTKELLKEQGAVTKAVVDSDSGNLLPHTTTATLPGRSLYGCYPRLAPEVEVNISRIPFMMTFKSGELKMTLAAGHLRFRAPSVQVIKEMLDTEFNPEGAEVPLFNAKNGLSTSPRVLAKIVKIKEEGGDPASLETKDEQDPEVIAKAFSLPLETLQSRLSFLISDMEVARYYEVKKVMEALEEIRDGNKNKVMMVGDFNLELKDPARGKVDYWPLATAPLKGAKVFITEKTSVGKTNPKGLVSNYDHFIFSPENLPECGETNEAGEFVTDAKAFNFTSEESFTSPEHIAWEDLVPYLLNIPSEDSSDAAREDIMEANQSVIKNHVDQYKESLAGFSRVMKDGSLSPITERNEKYRDCDTREKLDGTVFEKWHKGLECRVFKSQYKKRNRYQVFVEVMSDHLPVSISCKTGA